MSESNKTLVSFVIPCYRSKNTVKSVVDEIFSAVGALNIDKAAQHGALSGAGRPDDRDGLALVDGEGNAVEHAQLPEALFKIVYLKIMHSKDLQTAESE